MGDALEPSGNVLVLSIHFILYEYNGKSFTQDRQRRGRRCCCRRDKC